MYNKVLDAIKHRADRHGTAYVEDYGSSLHLTAHLPYEVTINIINQLEADGKINVIRTHRGTPVKVIMKEI